ncbi:TonB-dependent siderophore receptor [Methylomonas fluvii]|uniref:TonB-dependent receptor n=1 Tax=Methylomonas fluvii TaxID=1854564 RepID=A0ABR9DEG2_9GAMM|nr:TonB-dependent receptor [Methylomonas fluvii]MBD9361472.1 TonB-dependent receptor [Methylomonas fluvii]CAD6874423.1 TonB-dependent siderophore receptor [Methylomonas fluvii]
MRTPAFAPLSAPFAITALALSIASHTAYAEPMQQEARTYAIAAGGLTEALTAFADQANLKLVFNAELTRGLSAPALHETVTVEQGLNKLLKDSGLGYRLVGNGTAIIEAKPATNNNEPQSAATMPAVTVLGKAAYDANDPYNKDYALRDSATATKTDTPLMETPVNIQIVPKAVLSDQQAVTIDTALKNVSGVTASAGSGGLSDDLYLRGFRSSAIFRNGFRYDSEFSSWGKRQMANVERVEVVKGPASILYGRMEPGGMVNVVTKQPLNTPYYALQQQFGSFDFYRTTIDATGPLTDDDTLLYRMNASYENSGSYRELVDSERIFLAPVLKWNISARTQITFEMEYKHDNLVNDTMVWPYVDGRFIDMPRGRNLMEKTPENHDDILLGFNWSHQFNDDWSISHRFATERRDTPNSVAMLGDGLTGSQLNRIVVANPADINTYYTTLDVTGHFNTFGLKHTLLVGGDYYNNRSTGQYYYGDPAAGIDIYNPIHTGYSFPTGFDRYDTDTDFYGLYAQDQIQLPYGIRVMGGLRYQVVDQADKVAQSKLSADAVTPRVGVLWQAQDWLSLYGNYVENFGATNGLGQGGKPLPPESAQQWELGAKSEFFDGRLSATLAYFDLTKQNVATTDPNNPLFSIAVGEVRSRGPELDIKGEILPGWNMIATYANLDTRVTKDNDGREGRRMFAIPRNVGTFWNTYDFQQDALKGFKVGGGITMRDGSTNVPNTYNVPGFVTVDLMAAYNLKVSKSKITFQLNVNNLLDKNYLQDVIPGLGPNSRVNIGTPRTLLGSVKVEF